MNNKDIIVGINAYGLRYFLANGVMETIALIRRQGLDALEPLVGFEKIDQERFPNMVWSVDFLIKMFPEIEKAGIRIPSVHGFCLESADGEQIGKDINRIYENTGIKYYVFSNHILKTKKQCNAIAKVINDVTDTVNEKIMILYHPHENEFIMEDDTYLIDHLLALCPKLMLQVDMGWVKFAGVDPLDYMYSVKDRVRMLHFKDLISGFSSEIRSTSFAAVGKGVVGYSEILKHICDFDLNDYCLTICQDNSNGDLAEDLKYGVEFIKEELRKI